ncbi:hypothetical protein G3I67_14170 [Orrella sp. NBD-18]|uniref:Uncharacterized protein n=1 Tax=Sheuella amnicola TaxID=2707330 RepID=A0A6B2R0T6_9BURK|nr:hypothetical protein [Sheuella amnicola]NDY84376.1 hypothetical protein [Sheuella amnicola]
MPILLIFLLLLSASLEPVWAQVGANAKSQKVLVIRIEGSISNKVLESVRASVDQVQGDPRPAGLIVLLDSSGGDGNAAMKIGRILRRSKAHIFVTGQCLSACTYVLASGVVRGASAYTVGIHRGRITISDADAKVLKEVDVSKDQAAEKMMKDFERDAAFYFAEMGMPADLFRVMQAHEKKGVYRLSAREMSFYGLVGFDPNYLEHRTLEYESLKSPNRLDQNELVQRTAKVASICSEHKKNASDFVQCYKNVLKDPYLH